MTTSLPGVQQCTTLCLETLTVAVKRMVGRADCKIHSPPRDIRKRTKRIDYNVQQDLCSCLKVPDEFESRSWASNRAWGNPSNGGKPTQYYCCPKLPHTCIHVFTAVTIANALCSDRYRCCCCFACIYSCLLKRKEEDIIHQQQILRKTDHV